MDPVLEHHYNNIKEGKTRQDKDGYINTVVTIQVEDKNLNDGKYICRQDGYKVEDLNNNVIFIVELFDFLNEDEEIGDSQDAKYCTCGYYTRSF